MQSKPLEPKVTSLMGRRKIVKPVRTSAFLAVFLEYDYMQSDLHIVLLYASLLARKEQIGGPSLTSGFLILFWSDTICIQICI